MEYVIKNSKITAVISSNGAELRQLFDQNNKNRMHKPSPQTWNRVSPILFPFISRIKGGKYCVDGNYYEMPAHGFFRNMDITPCFQSEDAISFKITHSKETLSIYPYFFEFSVCYQLVDNKLNASFCVKNKGENEMLFMLGGHPGFNISEDEGEFEDYYLKFEQKENVKAMQVVDGFLANEFKQYLSEENIIPLKHELFIPDAIVLKDLKSKYVDILSNKNDSCIRFHFSDFNILAIWSLNDKNANFVCLEPWNGIQKEFVLDHKKMGVLNVGPNESKKYTYSIEIIK